MSTPPLIKEKLTTTDVAKGLLGWALCTLRLAVREANAFFQMYKHAREDNEKLRRESDNKQEDNNALVANCNETTEILADNGIQVAPYDWGRDGELVVESHAAIPMGLWDDLDVEDLGPLVLTIRTPQQLVSAGKQAGVLENLLQDIRDEFYGKEISSTGLVC